MVMDAVFRSYIIHMGKTITDSGGDKLLDTLIQTVVS